MPKISIITVAYNNRQGLEKTIQSVVSQTYRDYQFLIIDGGSTDGTNEFLKEHSFQIHYWISEPDKGIYNAMNKGIMAATGDYVIFMNSGDLFSAPDVLEKCIPYLTGEDIVYGDAYYETPERKYEYKIPRRITLGTLLKEPICHQSAFFRREFMIANGMYDENCRIASDHIFNLRVFIKGNPSQKHIPEYISVFDKTGISCTQPEKGHAEIRAFLNQNLSPELEKMAMEYDTIKHFYESPWGKTARRLKDNFYKIRYGK